MFNEDNKLRFLSEFTSKESTRRNYMAAFKAISPYEEKWGADFCTKSADVLQPVFESLCGGSVRSIVARRKIYTNYVQWCINSGFPGACDGAMNTVVKVSQSYYESTMIGSPTHLQRFLNTIYTPEELGYMDLIDRCMFWLLYSGVEFDDLMNLRKTDVDFNDLTVNVDGMKLRLYAESLPSVRFACTATELRFPSDKSGKRKSLATFERSDSEWILARTAKEDKHKTTLFERFSSQIEDLRGIGRDIQKTPTFTTVWKSGVFYREFQRETAGLPTSLPDIAQRYAEKREMRSKSNLKESKTNFLKTLRRDYKIWKEHFIR